MHDTALRCGAFFIKTYSKPGDRLLDIGSLDVNGSLRGSIPEGVNYVGLDIEVGKNVDIVSAPGDPFPFPDGYFDLVVSSSCFEHDVAFWETALEAARVLRSGGTFYFSAPSNGHYHSYPYDNWRFYPDSGVALTRWMQRRGHNMRLIESGVLERQSDQWNDFYCIMGKEHFHAPGRVYEHLTARNVRTMGGLVLETFEEFPEDVRLAHSLNAALQSANVELSRAEAELRAIKLSRSWRLIQAFGSIRNRFLRRPDTGS